MRIQILILGFKELTASSEIWKFERNDNFYLFIVTILCFQELANESTVPMNYYQVYGQVRDTVPLNDAPPAF